MTKDQIIRLWAAVTGGVVLERTDEPVMRGHSADIVIFDEVAE